MLVSMFMVCSILSVSAVDQPRDLPAWVQARVEALQPKTAERKFDQVGWAPSIVAAEKLARENNRPVFLFTQNGRIEIGRT